MQIEINIDYSAISKEAIYDYLDKREKEVRKRKKKRRLEKKRQEEEYEKTPLLIKKLTNAFLRYWFLGLFIFVSLLGFGLLNEASNYPMLFPSVEAIKNFAFALFFLPVIFFIPLRIVELFTTKKGFGKIKEKLELVRDNSKEIFTNLFIENK